MQAYGRVFARVYNLRWAGFARQAAPRILEFYAGTPPGQARQAVLDLCCGAGQLVLCFLESGFHVTGIDLSEHMLAYARENAQRYIETGRARFVQGDAANFTLHERFGLVVSTYDSLNHLDSLDALRSCFRSVFSVLGDDGVFIFDLNTRSGLMRWNSINVDDGEEALVVARGIYDGQGDRAFTKISGFVRMPDGAYERFDETVFNTVFDLQAVRQALLETGWRGVHFARLQDLASPLDDPEQEGRVFIVARK